ncbi:MAG: rod shape-determining protein MreC [Pseudomonadota bacterium]
MRRSVLHRQANLFTGEADAQRRNRWRWTSLGLALVFSLCLVVSQVTSPLTGTVTSSAIRDASSDSASVSQTFIQQVRVKAYDLAVPVLSIIKRPITALQDTWTTYRQSGNEAEIISTLRRRVAELEVWQVRAEELEQKLSELAKLAEVVTVPNLGFSTAEVVGQAADPRHRRLIIAAGANAGRVTGQPVVSAQGLIGTILTTTGQSAIVRLLTEKRVTVDVLVGTSRKRARIIGQGGANMLLDMAPWDLRQTGDGDLVVTSGNRGRLPRGLRIGRVVQRGNNLLVQPFLSGAELRFVSVLEFSPAIVSMQENDLIRAAPPATTGSIPPPAKGPTPQVSATHRGQN